MHSILINELYTLLPAMPNAKMHNDITSFVLTSFATLTLRSELLKSRSIITNLTQFVISIEKTSPLAKFRFYFTNIKVISKLINVWESIINAKSRGKTKH